MYMSTTGYISKREQKSKGRLGITRGQAILSVFAIVLFLFAMSTFVFASDAKAENIVFKEMTVKKGDNLWSIANRYHEQAGLSVPDFIEEIVKVNELPTTTIYPGKILVIPVEQR